MSRRGLARIVLRTGVSAALVGWLVSRVDLRAVSGHLSDIGPLLVGAVLVLQAVNTAIKAWKWKSLLAADGIALPFPTAFATYMVATFFNLFLPSSVGGDAFRALDAHRRSGRGTASVTSVAIDRLLGFVALGLLGLAGLWAGAAASLEPELRVTGIVVYVTLAGGTALLFLRPTLRRIRRLPLGRFPRAQALVGSVSTSLEAYREKGRLLFLTTLSAAGQGILIVVVFAIARSVGITAHWHVFLAVVPLVVVLEALPVSIYGLGIRDVSYVYLLGLFGVTEAQALSLSILYVLLTLLYALLGAVVFALRRTPVGKERTR